MLYSTQRTDMRQMYFDAWQKHQHQKPLEALEQQIVDVIIDHPEYLYLFENPEKYIDYDFNPEIEPTNPFMHLSMHLAIRDQVNTNQPAGIRDLFVTAVNKKGDALDVEHCFMQVLITEMYSIQNELREFDSELYLEQLRKISG